MKIINYTQLDDSFYEKIEFENIPSVCEIINSVRKNGDRAIKEYNIKFNDGDFDNFRLTDKEIKSATESVDKNTLSAMRALMPRWKC